LERARARVREQSDMKILLVFPPQFDPTIPNLALPCLTAVLRAAGHEVVQRDLNVESNDILLSAEELERAFQKIGENYNTLRFFGSDTGKIDRLMSQKDILIREIENAKKVWRAPRDFYDYQRFMESKHRLEDGLRVISLAYPNSYLSFIQFEMYYSTQSTEQILKAVQDPSLNLYIDFYMRHIISGLIREAPQVVGISIAAVSQVIPGLTLAYLLKRAIKNVHIVIGGTYFTNLRENLIHNTRLFSLVDSIILYEGETALTKLVDCLESGRKLTAVPNLIFKTGGKIVVNDNVWVENLDELPTPTFEGLPLQLYFSPHPVLPLYASRGCYWKQCAFCNHSAYIGNQYRLRSATKVKADMEELIQKYHCHTVGLVDLALSPSAMSRLATAIIDSGLQINWYCMTRFEKELDQPLCVTLAKSGCKMLQFGLESGSSRVLTLMDKGVNPDLIETVLAVSSQAGIGNFVSCFIGFPTETLQEAKETIGLIRRNLKNIIAISIGSFNLDRNSMIHCNPGRYKIRELFQKNHYDLSWGFNYRVEEGLSQQEATTIAHRFKQSCQNSYMELFDIFLPYVLYAVHFNRNNLLWLKTNPQEKNRSAIDEAQERNIAVIEQKITDLLNDL
jgi:hypothetical protein